MNGSWAVQWCPLLLDLRFLVLPWKIISLSIVNVITGWTCFNKKALNHSPEWLMFGRPPIHWAASLFPAVNPSWTPATHWPWTLAGSVIALRNTSAWFLYPLKLSCVLIQFIEQNILMTALLFGVKSIEAQIYRTQPPKCLMPKATKTIIK